MMTGHQYSTVSQGTPLVNLRIYLLGLPRIEVENQPLAISRRQTRALIYRLAASRQAIPREILCAQFWPEIREDAARRNLSRLLTILHHSLPWPDLLLTSEDQISLNHELVWADTHTFLSHWDLWNTQHAIENIRQAVGLVRGSFLEGFSLSGSSEFEIWVAIEREHWNRMVLDGLGILIDVEARNSEFKNATEYARQYLRIDPLNEVIHRRLMELYVQAGDRAAAARQYEQCAIVLEKELGVDPLPETQAIFHAIQNEQITYPKPPVRTPEIGIIRSLDVPLIGRENALSSLRNAFAMAKRKQCQVVLVAGEAGIGKSRLVQEFIAEVQEKATIFIGPCYQESQDCPYQPIIEALRSRFATGKFPIIGSPPWLADVTRLLPELASHHPGLLASPPSEPGWARARLFEAIESLMAWLVADPQPTVLFLDDLHWADPATLDWLVHYARHQPKRLLIIGNYRTEEKTRLTGLIHSLVRQGILTELTLSGLTERDISYLIKHVENRIAFNDAVTKRIYEVTGGNPFFLLEMIRALYDNTRLTEQPSTADNLIIPASIRAAVQARLMQLSANAHQVLEGCAIIGHKFDLATVMMTAGRSEQETLNALEEAISRELLLSTEINFQFRHDIVREVIYQDLSFYRRKLLHRRAGESIEKLRPAAVTDLALHFEQGGRPGIAARYALQAGCQAKNLFAHVEARAWFDRALGLLHQEALSLHDQKAIQVNLRARIEALSERGWAFRLVGDMASYMRDLEEETHLVELLHEPESLAHVCQRLASAHNWFCRYQQAQEAAEEGVCLSQSAKNQMLEALCWREKGLSARALGDYIGAEDALQRALHICQSLDQDRLCVHVLGNLATLYMYKAEFEKSAEVGRQALILCNASHLILDRRLPLGDLGALALAMGNHGTARQFLEESLGLAHQAADSTQEILCLGYLGWLDIAEDTPHEALTHLQAALCLAEKIDSCAEQSWLHTGLAEGFYQLGQQELAWQHAKAAGSLADGTGRLYDQQLAHHTLERISPSKPRM